MDPKYLNDQWTLGDDLGIAGTGDLLARMALEVQPPFSVRVTGKWGSEKTTDTSLIPLLLEIQAQFSTGLKL